MSDLIEQPTGDLYEGDFHAWTQTQAALLRQAAALRVNLPIDWENVAEEIESLGRSDKREIGNRLAVLLQHLLKLAYSPDHEPRSGWQRTVREQRDQIGSLIKESPSLKSLPAEVLADRYARAREEAAFDLGLPVDRLPEQCPFAVEAEALNRAWWPAPPGGSEAS